MNKRIKKKKGLIKTRKHFYCPGCEDFFLWFSGELVVYII